MDVDGHGLLGVECAARVEHLHFRFLLSKLLFTESRDDLAELMELMAQTHGWWWMSMVNYLTFWNTSQLVDINDMNIK